MFKKIGLLVCHNQYESKHYFTKKLAEAFERKGIEAPILSWDTGPVPESILQKIKSENFDLTGSFHSLPAQKGGKYFWMPFKSLIGRSCSIRSFMIWS